MSLALASRRAAISPAWVKSPLWRTARAVPSLDQPFADTKSLVDAVTGQSLVTFTRASSGTSVGSDGVLRTAAVNEPRFDHNPTTGESLGLLVEEQRTNLLLRSEEFDNASWLLGAGTVTANTQPAPTGAATADTFTTTLGTPILYQDVTCTASTVYTFSFYVRLGTMPASDFRFAVRDNTGAAFIATDIAPSVTPVTTEWRRVSYTFTTPVGCVQVRPYLYRFTFVTGGTVHLWGAQLEAGAFPTSYIPTTTAAATRSADVASITGTAFSSWYRQDEGTIYGDYVERAFSATHQIASVSNGTTSERISLAINSSNVLDVGVVSANTDTFAGNTPTLTSQAYKIGFAYKTDNSGVSANGSAVTIDSAVILPAVSQLDVGARAGTAQVLNSTIRRLAFWPQRLPDSTLQAITQ